MDGSSFFDCVECGQPVRWTGGIFCSACVRRRCLACGIVLSNQNQCRCGQYHGRTRDGVYCIDCHSVGEKNISSPRKEALPILPVVSRGPARPGPFAHPLEWGLCHA